jgi:DNA-binding CsgD family transcriptional regulator
MPHNSAASYLERILEVSRILQTQEVSADDICQILAMKLVPHSPISMVGIFQVDSHGTYSLTASYGVSDASLPAWDKVSMDSVGPIVDALRRTVVVSVTSPADLLERYPQALTSQYREFGAPMIIVPMSKLGNTAAAIGLAGSLVDMTPEYSAFFEVIAGLVALKLRSQEDVVECGSGPPKRNLRGGVLTYRQELIQALMALGKTNQEIAEELGYSESTIKQDAIVLFSKLGVSSRKAAGDLAEDA